MKQNINFIIQSLKLNLKPVTCLSTNPSIRWKHGGTVTRGNYSSVTSTHLTHFEGILGKYGLSTDEEELVKYNNDWFATSEGTSKLVLLPKTTQEVREILKYCNQERLAVCPQGGNTGVVAGGVPVFDEIILSTSRMNEIISLDEISGALVCQSGCILERLDQHVSEKKLMIPLDLGAKGSCQIGGNISTNAGGLRVLRYGNLHGNLLGLEAVTANGTILDVLTQMKKDNTGYALKNLFIGSEGTLGVVTKVAIQCVPRPNAVNLAFLGVKNYKDVIQVLKIAKHDLSEILSAFEYMDESTMNCVQKNLKLRAPFEGFPFYILIETSGSNAAHDEEKLQNFLSNVMKTVKSTDGTVAADITQRQSLWSLRERIPEAQLKDGYLYTYDLSIPASSFDDLVQDMRSQLGSNVLRCSGFGHLGDGNIHLTISTKKFDQKVMDLESHLYDWVKKRNGSVSAEHGIGFLKRNYSGYSKSPETLQIMQDLKKYFDPNGILNPYKMFQCK